MTSVDMLKEIEEVASETCNEWECDFVESCSAQVASGRTMSQKQTEIIERIYAKVCSSPF